MPQVLDAPFVSVNWDLIVVIAERVARHFAATLPLRLPEPPRPSNGLRSPGAGTSARIRMPGWNWFRGLTAELCTFGQTRSSDRHCDTRPRRTNRSLPRDQAHADASRAAERARLVLNRQAVKTSCRVPDRALPKQRMQEGTSPTPRASRSVPTPLATSPSHDAATDLDQARARRQHPSAHTSHSCAQRRVHGIAAIPLHVTGRRSGWPSVGAFRQCHKLGWKWIRAATVPGEAAPRRVRPKSKQSGGKISYYPA